MTPLDHLAALLDPLTVGEFFDRHYERAPLHLPGSSRRDAPILTHDALVGALTALPDPPEGLVAFPEHLSSMGARGATPHGLVRDRALLRAYLDEGHPVVWNRARGLTPELDALCRALAEAFGAHVWPNVYSTGTAGTPFDAHFDGHEVLALQCEGEKRWWISEVRVDRPLDVTEMGDAVRAALVGRRDEALARTLMTFTAAPGDVVYLPRGQFHNASTPAGRSLHVTFGIQLLTGVDVLQVLARLCVADPAFREYLPAAPVDPDGGRAVAQLSEVVAKLRELTESELFAREILRARANLVRGSGASDKDRAPC